MPICLSASLEAVRARLLPLLSESADPGLAVNNLERLLCCEGLPDVSSLLQGSAHLAETLSLLLGSSQSLADILMREPGVLGLLGEREWLTRSRTREEIVGQLWEAAGRGDSSLEVMNRLRREKQKEVLRIAAGDLGSFLSFEAVVEQITVLAEGCLEVAVRRSLEEVGLSAGEGFCVLGLGKLGGNELNYSSDVDVLFVYRTPEPVDVGATHASPLQEAAGVGVGVTNHAPAEQCAALYARVARRIVEILGRGTEEGRLFRVDARLRPQGESGPLVRSLDSYLAHYEAYGQPWERQALLKARPVAGDMGLGWRFVESVSPFIYARRLDEEAKSHLRAIKERYERRLMEEGALDSDVKQGHGGIRDVEFTVQVLQLICGGDEMSVRERGTLPAIKALRKGGYLSPEEAEALREAYIFLRTLEHRLQLMFEVAVTRVPVDEAELLKVARRTLPEYKMTSAGTFRALYERLTDKVREIYQRVLEVEGSPALPSSPLGPWSLPEAQQDAAGLRQRVAQYGFQNPGAALRVIEMMSRGPGLSSAPAELVGGLLPQVLEACYASGDADNGLRNFERFSFLCGPKDIFYLTLCDNPRLTRTLGLLAGRSQFLSDILIEHPQFLDIILDRSFLETPSSKRQLLSELSERVAESQDLSASLNLLRRFKHRELLRIGIRDLEGIADWQSVGEEISDLAEVCLETGLGLVLGHLYGKEEQPRLAIFGLGKLGGRELHYASDLDLLFVSEGWENVDEQQRQEKVAEETVGALSEVTEEGVAFKVDLRLRPEGKAGALLRSLEGYAGYFSERLETWQRQALIRARAVAGDAGVCERFSGMVEKAVFGAEFKAETLEEIVAMRDRIQRERRAGVGGSAFDVKNGRGGIVELEFLVQLLQLANGQRHAAVRTPCTSAAIERMVGCSILTEEQGGTLLNALGFLKRLENQLQMGRQRPSSNLPATAHRQNVLARQLGYSERPPLAAREPFLRDLQRTTNAVREVWESTVALLRNRLGAT